MTNKVRFILDEFPTAVGRMQCIDDAIAVGRGFGVSMAIIAQSAGQLKTLYPEGGDSALLASMSCQVYASILDLSTAESVAERIGDRTIELASNQKGGSYSRSTDAVGMGSTQWGSNDGVTTSETRQALLSKAQAMLLGDGVAIVFCPNTPPIKVRLVPWYTPEFKELLRSKSGSGPSPFARACGLFVLALAAAVAAAVFAFQ